MSSQKKIDREDLFVSEYLIDLNATQAYLRAYPKSTPGTARTEGCKLLANPNIQEKISKAKAERAERTKVDQDRVVRELSRIAFAKKPDFRGWNYKGNRLRITSKVKALEVLLEHVANENEAAAGSQVVNFSDLIKKANESKGDN